MSEYPNFMLFCENNPDRGWWWARNRGDISGNVQILDCCEDIHGRDTVEFECPVCNFKHWSNVRTER